MHKFVRSVITEWRRLGLLVEDASVVVAVSGGADSMSLIAGIHDLTKRKKLNLNVIVAHFNHGLRGVQSDDDEAFVRRYADQLGLDFRRGSGSISKKGNLEQNARNARYDFLRTVANDVKANSVLTAHTRNDQAETLLINLIRGAGPDGLAGMRSVRPLAEAIILVRPLIRWATRADTESYCRDLNIAFRADSMNDDLAFTRVRVRKSIIPAMAELNPRIVETLASTAELMVQERQSGPPPSKGGGSYDLRIAKLQDLSQAELYETLRSWLRMQRGDLRAIQRKHIEGIERLILSRKSGKTAELPRFGTVVKHGGKLVFRNIKVEK